MSVRDDLERGWTELPADCAPISGHVIERLREVDGPIVNWAHEFIQDGRVTRDPPAWVTGRTADAWLVAVDDGLCAPLVWRDGVLVATVLAWRDEDEWRARERSKLTARAEYRARRRAREVRSEPAPV